MTVSPRCPSTHTLPGWRTMRLVVVWIAMALAVHAAPSSDDVYYPHFHVRPPTNWINDPNGPFRDPTTNMVHLWMQYNPDGAVWGNMSWWHTVTEDYVTWQQVGVSLTNDASYDVGGVFSGSVSLDERGDPVIFYTCVDAHHVQRQCIATPEDRHGDPLLQRWVKSTLNPILTTLPNENGVSNFRDPTTGWIASTSEGADVFYFVTGGSIVPPGGQSSSAVAMVPIFQSPNVASLTSNFSFTGKFLFEDPYELSLMFECPDFFALPTYKSAAGGTNATTWVVKASSMTTRHDYFYVGTYNPVDTKFASTTTPVAVDYGMWYASKTFWDASLQARILFGWINEEDDAYEARGWAGLQSIPRVVVYDNLLEAVRTYPLPALEALRGAALAHVTTAADVNNSACYPLVAPSLNGTTHMEVVVELSVPLLDAFHVELRVLEAAGSDAVRTAVSVDSAMPGGGAVWQDTDQPGGDYKDFRLPGTDVDADVQNCSQACDNDRRCLAWTYVRSGNPAPPPFNYAPRCSLKYLLPPQLSLNASCCISGRPTGALLSLDRSHSSSTGNTAPWQGRALILPDPFSPARGRIKLHVFVDASVVEAFKDDGLERVSGRVYVPAHDLAMANGASVCANTTPAGANGVQLLQATVWPLGSIW